MFCVGWLHHRTQVTNVDIPIEPGWTLVPIDKLPELKLLCTEGTRSKTTNLLNAYFFRVINFKIEILGSKFFKDNLHW